jgi:hypothetical protein
MKQKAAFLGIYLVCLVIHALLFKDSQNSWADAVTKWQWLYVIYFLVAYVVCELGHRYFGKRE